MVLLQLTSPPSLLPHWEALGPEGGILSLCPLPHGLSMGNVPQQKSQFNSTHILSLHYCQLVVLFLNKPMLLKVRPRGGCYLLTLFILKKGF